MKAVKPHCQVSRIYHRSQRRGFFQVAVIFTQLQWIFPKARETHSISHLLLNHLAIVPLSFFPSQAQPVAIPCRSRQGNDPDCGLLKDTICRLYSTNELNNVIWIMEEDYKFKARYDNVLSLLLFFPILILKSAKLYKTKFCEWDVDTKRIKPCEYKAMLKRKRKREQDEPRKETRFQLRGECVPDFKIARWETRMLIQGRITNIDTFSQYGEHYPIPLR